MKEYHVHTGRPSWHQQRAGHRSAGITVFTTREAADGYAKRVLLQKPYELVFVVEEEIHRG